MSEVKYVLRTVGFDYKSYGGFKWPKRGKVQAPDWIDSKECGNGLHGALWGEGNGSLFSWSPNAVWQVVKVDGPCIDLDGKVKFEKGYVVYSGDRKTATDKIIKLGAKGAVIGATVSSGDRGSSTSGDSGSSTSGDRGSSISGDYGSSISGAGGSSTSGAHGSSISGDSGSSISGAGGSSTSGDSGSSISGAGGSSISGAGGSSTSGDFGSSISGAEGSSTSGVHGSSTSGHYGSSTSGIGGVLVIKYWDEDSKRYRLKTGYVGEDGIKPNVAYRLNDKHEFEEVE